MSEDESMTLVKSLHPLEVSVGTEDDPVCEVCQALVQQLEPSSTSTPNSQTWSKDLPKGGLAGMLSRLPCSVCELLLHLASPLEAKTFIEWARAQPPALLDQYRCYVQIRDQSRGRGRGTGSVIGRVFWQRPDRIDRTWVGNITSLAQGARQSQLHAVDIDVSRDNPIDFATVRTWIDDCESNHEDCRRKMAFFVADTPDSELIRLIDVVDECLVDFEPWDRGIRYVALSYVWGDRSSFSCSRENYEQLQRPGALRERQDLLPLTIIDAMEAVRRLGERYLWVDRLCIVQDDNDDKERQLSHMAEIYARAYATILQFSGKTAYDRLPGVRPGTRSSKQSSNGRLVSKERSSILEPGPVHRTRAWTLQEEKVSTRRIYFCDKAVYFECETVMRDEVVLAPAAAPMFKDRHGEKGFSWQKFLGEYDSLLKAYTSRNLSYESDIDNGFLAIQQYLSRLSSGRFRFGLPEQLLAIALAWQPPTSYEDKTNIRRRLVSIQSEAEARFPSWSWEGWISKICLASDSPRAQIAPCIGPVTLSDGREVMPLLSVSSDQLYGWKDGISDSFITPIPEGGDSEWWTTKVQETLPKQPFLNFWTEEVTADSFNFIQKDLVEGGDKLAFGIPDEVAAIVEESLKWRLDALIWPGFVITTRNICISDLGTDPRYSFILISQYTAEGQEVLCKDDLPFAVIMLIETLEGMSERVGLGYIWVAHWQLLHRCKRFIHLQ